MNNNNYIIIGKNQISEDQIPTIFPLSVAKYQESFNEVVKGIVKDVFNISVNNKYYSVYVNLLANKSQKTKYIAMIIELSKSYQIKEIHFDYISPKLSSLFQGQPRIAELNSANNLIDKKELRGVFPKYIVNLIFTLLGIFIRKKKGNTESVIRAWVDVDEKLHEKEFYQSAVLIYPFGLNIKRSFSFIKKVFKTHSNVKLTGVNYSFLDALNSIFARDKVESLVKFEFNGMFRHSKKLLKYKTIYTSDEFQVGVPILYQNRNHSKIINRAHGMGCYNLEVDYDEFHVFNEVQRHYYQRNNSKIDYKIYPSKKDIVHENSCESKIVYIDQGDLRRYHFYYEIELQKKVIQSLEEVAKLTKTEIFVKFHPNRSEAEIKEFNKLYKLQALMSLDDKTNYTFINLWSTSYFDFKKHGRFIFVKDDHFNAHYFFGEKINSVHIDDLKTKLLNNDN